MSALPEPRTPEGGEGLAALRRDPGQVLVALDFDGTLAPLVPRPEDVAPAPGALEALAALSDVVGAVVLLTGRPAEVVVDRAGLADAPGLSGLAVLGHYGLERWEAATDTLSAPPADPGVAALRAPVQALVDAEDGVVLEDKGASLAVHTRRAADPGAALARLEGPLRVMAGQRSLEVVPGRFVLELRPPGVDKGSALRAEADRLGSAAVLFAGDDLGDLPAFEALRSLRVDGVACLGVASVDAEADPRVAAAADLVLDGPEAVVAFLAALAEDLRGR